jgi:uncharacterized protein YgiM (DUF1202 family)
LLQPNKIPAEYSENFIFTHNKSVIDGTGFEVTFETEDVGLKLVRVRENEWGFLNVRAEPSLGASVVTQINPGNVFIEKKRNNGWVQLELNDGTIGWVSGGYVERIND